MPDLNYTAPPTCARFMKSEAFLRVIAGPVGSGKTVACIVELLRRSMAQSPGEDGLRHTRFAVVRQTLKQLKDTILKDCRSWLAGLGEWKVSDSTFYLNFEDVRSEWLFIPLEDAADQARLLSSQLTGAWGSEIIEMKRDILAPLSGRIGRYPSGRDGAPTWQGIIGDTNMPMEMSEWHDLFADIIAGLVPDAEFFRQPSGLARNAENLNYLNQTEETQKLLVDHPARIAQGRGYYERFVNMYGIDSDWVKRYVKAEYGPDPSGMVVFRESFRTDFHVVDETMVIPGYPLIVGQDFGRDPWSLICQTDHMGRLLIHEEVTATNIGLEKHVQEHLRPRLSHEKYLGHRVAVVGDPAGVAKGTISEETSFDALKRMGLFAFPAVTNDIDPRIRAVEALLARQTNGGPTLLINKRTCPRLIVALASGYRYTKTKEGQRRSLPDKNEWSHVVDALQYVCLVVHGGLVPELTRRLRPQTRTPRESMPSGAWT